MANGRKISIYEASDILHQAATLHLCSVPHDYGTGEPYTSTEVHTLSYIVDNPGISVTQLANDYGKTKGAISQMLKKLTEKGLVRKEVSPQSDRIYLLFPTEKGLQLHAAHKQVDTLHFGKSYKALCELYSPEEVNSAWTILKAWVQIHRRLDR